MLGTYWRLELWATLQCDGLVCASVVKTGIVIHSGWDIVLYMRNRIAYQTRALAPRLMSDTGPSLEGSIFHNYHGMVSTIITIIGCDITQDDCDKIEIVRPKCNWLEQTVISLQWTVITLEWHITLFETLKMFTSSFSATISLGVCIDSILSRDSDVKIRFPPSTSSCGWERLCPEIDLLHIAYYETGAVQYWSKIV